ncbi:endo-1,4-beta-xylanase [Pelagicoccus sp. SDUM812002]|uniref:endo-1,4-beta-xylanase n=1 Tax=Pelagicoccus sp. SDUM812002 TaxID=3041266 RepID=UPI00280FDF8C|nr:endo-1,4-beta-xylanase [Pelagicoccus sp. SDUM812002]MDQ8185168.1 endo-1,4-beta-xylanase [Pelagicoccus sp. SDUM812002]
MKLKSILTIPIFSLALTSLSAQTELPSGKQLLRSPGLDAFSLQLMPSAFDSVSIDTVDTESDFGFDSAWRIETKGDTGPWYAVQLQSSSFTELKKGDTGIVRFFARTLESADESGLGQIGVGIRPAIGWGRGMVSETFNAPEEWGEFLVPFTADADYERFEAQVSFTLGYRAQTIEIGGLECLTFGDAVAFSDLPRTRFTYEGRETNSAWREAALERIEEIRKGDLSIRVVDAKGKPVRNAKLTLAQTESAFEWGTAIPFERLLVDTPDNLIFREKVLELFNAASPENDLKWGAWLGEFQGNFNREQALDGLKWLQEHDIPTRGHVLVWPGRGNLPDQVRELLGTPEQDQIQGIVLDHIREISAATKDYLYEWDVLNEPYTNHDLMDALGKEIMVEWFEVAREEMPDMMLYLNDFSNHDFTTDAEHVQHFEDTARYLVDNGAPLDALGLQAHIGGKPNAPENVLATLDRYWNAFNLPIRITEFDIRTTDEELQADYTRDFFTLAFSHPSIVGVQLWGFWENAHWIPTAAMYREDWSEKPSVDVYKSLLFDQWRTNLESKTDKEGTFATRAFFGDYTVTVQAGNKEIEYSFALPRGESKEVEIQLP